MKLKKGTEITPASLASILALHASEKSRVLRLRGVFDGWSDIKQREYSDTRKPTNRIDVPYPAYIVNTAMGHLLSRPVTYKSDDKVFLDKISEVFRDMEEAEVNLATGELAGIAGYAYQLSFTDGSGNFRSREVCPSELIVVHDNTLLEEVQFAVRYVETIDLEKNKITYIDVYTDSEIQHYIQGNEGEIKLIDSEEHYFGEVPVAIFEVNNQRYGLFEKVLDLINEYAQLASDTANDFEAFCNAILVVSGYLIDDEEKADFLETLMLQFNDGEGDAKYLIKDMPSEALEAYKTRLDNDIHKYSFVPNMTDESFSTATSGIAMEFKLMGLDHLIGIIERKFAKGLSDRMRQYCRFASVEEGAMFEHTNIEAVFTKNRPVNATEITDMIVKLAEKGIMSNDTLMAVHPLTTDVEKEKEAIKEGTLSGDLNNVIAGILSKQAFLVKWYGMTDQEALAVLEQIQVERELTENSYSNPFVDNNEDEEDEDNTDGE